MALVRWIQMGILLGSLLFGWLLGSKNEETHAPDPTVPKMEITVRLQDGESESLWTGFVVLADSTAMNAPSLVEVNLDTGWSSVSADSDESREGDCDSEPGTEFEDRSKLRSPEWASSLQSVNRKVERLVDVWVQDWAWVGNLKGKQ